MGRFLDWWMAEGGPDLPPLTGSHFHLHSNWALGSVWRAWARRGGLGVMGVARGNSKSQAQRAQGVDHPTRRAFGASTSLLTPCFWRYAPYRHGRSETLNNYATRKGTSADWSFPLRGTYLALQTALAPC
jgi:hypothetical protein